MDELGTRERQDAKRSIIISQCFGMVLSTAFVGMILLLYMKALGMDGAAIVLCLSIQPLVMAGLGLPLAAWSDRFGKKLFGQSGLWLMMVAAALLISAGWVAPGLGQAAIVLALACFSIGVTFFGAGWLALLFPIIPQAEHGRFFAVMRTSFQLVGILFSMWCMWMLHGAESDTGIFHLIFVVALVAQLVRILFYHRIPELEPPDPEHGNIWAALVRFWNIPRFAPFSVYLFLFSFFTANRLALFGLVEKEVLGMQDSRVVLLGMLTQAGLLAGFAAGGWAVDRFKTKKVFVAGHFFYTAVLLLFVLRGAFGLLMVPMIGISHFLLGFVSAGVSIAVVTERLALLPRNDRSLASAVTGIMISLGVAGGSAFSGLILKMNVLRSEWHLFGLPLSDYDALIVFFGIMVILMLVALAPLPNALRKAIWLPRGDMEN
ncbi:MAG: MFS transporter [Kiritimatiellales bacterium]|nr:MFS transporter [Kiritimatiellales bacterium]